MDTTQYTQQEPINSVTRNEQTDLDKRATKALLRKIDLRLMPLLTLLYFFSFLDRINIGIKRTSIYILSTRHVLSFFTKGMHVFLGLKRTYIYHHPIITGLYRYFIFPT
jgi:hypothetical protein